MLRMSLKFTVPARSLLVANDETDDRTPVSDSQPEPERIVRAEELFRDRQELWIELHGERYRLRITRRGKLILQK